MKSKYILLLIFIFSLLLNILCICTFYLKTNKLTNDFDTNIIQVLPIVHSSIITKGISDTTYYNDITGTVNPNLVMDKLGEPVFFTDTNGILSVDVASTKGLFHSGIYQCNHLFDNNRLVALPDLYIYKLKEGCKL